MQPDKWIIEIWPSTFIQRYHSRYHSLPCVSLSHPLVNLPEVFSRLKREVWGSDLADYRLVVKNHISSTAPQNLKARVSAAIPSTSWGGWCEWPCHQLHQEVLIPALQSQQSQSYIIASIVFAQTCHWGLGLRMNASSYKNSSMSITGASQK